MPKNEGLALVGLDEVRHVGVDHTRRDRINADTARPERRREVLHQRVDRALRGRIGRQGADGGVRPEGKRRESRCCPRQARESAMGHRRWYRQDDQAATFLARECG